MSKKERIIRKLHRLAVAYRQAFYQLNSTAQELYDEISIWDDEDNDGINWNWRERDLLGFIEEAAETNQEAFDYGKTDIEDMDPEILFTNINKILKLVLKKKLKAVQKRK